MEPKPVKKTKAELQKDSEQNAKTLSELNDHYKNGKDDNEQRKERENGWDDVLKAYLGVLPDNWPFLSQVTDPVIRTVILEKNARLLNGRLRGQVNPREGGDIVKAKVQNAVINYQWDVAKEGGSMLEKWALMDLQTRIFGASFGLVYWKGKGFEGNEFKVLDNNNVFVDYSADHIRDAKWVQVREWKTLEGLRNANENSGVKIYQNLDELEKLIEDRKTGDRRDMEYTSVVKQSLGIEDRVGTDSAFPEFEIVTEYRKDRWISFSPEYNIIIRDIPNPYKHNKIPVVQLRYYPTGGDVYGSSEVAMVMPLSRSIDAVLCGAIDEINLRMRPPIKVANSNTVRLDTLEYGPNALWLVGNSQGNVMEMQTGGDVINNFQAMYSALKSAVNNAMGEMSQGIGDSDPFNGEKTATEIRSSERQKLSRDQQNQMYLEQGLIDMMELWISNNRQFMFSGENSTKVMRILGRETMQELKDLGLNNTVVSQAGLDILKDLIEENGADMSELSLLQAGREIQVPEYPVIMNPEEKDLGNLDIRKKLEVDKNGEGASLILEKEDFEEMFDYVPAVKSMSIDADEVKRRGREKAFNLILQPQVQQQLQLEGSKARIKELLVQVLDDNGVSNADKFFEDAQQGGMAGQPEQPGQGDIGQGLPSTGASQAQGMGGFPASNFQPGEATVPKPQEAPRI